MERAAIITGIGLVTSLGHSADETWRALLAGRAIVDHTRVNLAEPAECSRVSRLALRTAREALAHAGWDERAMRDNETALIIGTSKGTIEDWTTAGRIGSCDGLSEIASDVARRCNFRNGPRLTLSAACASGLHALIRATMMIRSGDIKRALVIAAEASVNPLFIASFRRLGILAPEGHGCRPFDQNRKGFLISEGAAAVCLECASEENAGGVLARVDRFTVANDATHLTASDPNATALRYALKNTIAENPIDVIHAHGTATEMNDATELAVLEETLHQAQPFMAGQFEQTRPILYSHKGALGHSLGASGLISIALNALMHHHNVVPGNIRTTNPLHRNELALCQSPLQREIKRSLAIAAGFGGALGVVSLARV
jgi:3-oxoacyl-[acyl-carrier-protein] synthase II